MLVEDLEVQFSYPTISQVSFLIFVKVWQFKKTKMFKQLIQTLINHFKSQLKLSKIDSRFKSTPPKASSIVYQQKKKPIKLYLKLDSFSLCENWWKDRKLFPHSNIKKGRRRKETICIRNSSERKFNYGNLFALPSQLSP